MSKYQVALPSPLSSRTAPSLEKTTSPPTQQALQARGPEDGQRRCPLGAAPGPWSSLLWFHLEN